MKYYKIVLLFIITVAFFACKTEASDSTVYKVTIDQGFATGLTQTEYNVTSGDTLKKSDLKDAPNIDYMIPNYKIVGGGDFTLDQTPVTSDLNLKIEWQNDPSINCDTKSDAVAKFLDYASAGDTLALACAIKNQVNVNIKSYSNNNTALINASLAGKFEAIKYLRANGANISDMNSGDVSPLIASASSGSLDSVKYLLAHGSSVSEHGPTFKYTALEIAAQGGKLDIVKYLIGIGADINAVDYQGLTALIAASNYARNEVVQYLLESAGANINEVDIYGQTALMNAAGTYAETIAGDRLKLVTYLATYPNADLALRATDGTYKGFTALGIAKDQYNFYTDAAKKAIFDSIVKYLTSLYTQKGIPLN